MGSEGAVIEFEVVDRGLRVIDTVEEVEYVVEAGPVAPESAPPEQFPVPVDDAVCVRTGQLYLPTVVDYHIRDGEGGTRQLVVGDEQSVTGTTFLEATNTPMKLYLRVEGAATIGEAESGSRISFDGESSVVVGARSLHQQPAGTVTVPETPTGVARGVSLFASALKTTSPERSFLTLRGHPPLLEFGDEFDADGLDRPETGIEIHVPDEYSSVFTVAPLSYYLGAAVHTGAETPHLVADGESFPLTGDLPEATADTLQHCFLLDCVTRTEGLYPVPLHEREVLAERTAIDPERWYDMPVGRRTAAYLSVPREATADLLDWHLTADVEPTAGNAAVLPFVVDDLALVRSPTPLSGQGDAPTGPDGLEEFFRTDEPRGLLRSSRATRHADPVEESVLSPVDTETYGHVWVGEQFPMGASKPTVEAYERRLDRQPADDSTTTVTLVCNDEEMLEEIDEELYGFFEMLRFDVRSHYDLTKAELREVLREETSFLHYVGHVEDEGMQCTDGYLDVRTLENAGVEAFLLNGCTSYEQGQALVDAGAFGGVVTLTSVSNAKATETGRNLARLLDVGFDFHGALDVIRRTRISPRNYVVVGDGRVTISQADTGALYVYEVTDVDEASISVDCLVYPTRAYDVGSIGRTHASDGDEQRIAVGDIGSYTLDEREFADALGSEHDPILVDERIRWTDSYDPFA